MIKRPRILTLPTQLQIFIEISRIEFSGNQVKIFISLDSASLTESETLFRLQKISTGKKFASRNSAYIWSIIYSICLIRKIWRQIHNSSWVTLQQSLVLLHLGRGSYSRQLWKLLRPHHRLVPDGVMLYDFLDLMRVQRTGGIYILKSGIRDVKNEVRWEPVLIFWSGQELDLSRNLWRLLRV